jgi:hypothetical protein
MSYLRYLCLFACGGVQHISCCVFIPPLHQGGGGAVNCFTSVHPSIHPRYFSSHFSQQLLMAEI